MSEEYVKKKKYWNTSENHSYAGFNYCCAYYHFNTETSFILKGKRFQFIVWGFLHFAKGYSIYKHNSYQEQSFIIPL